MPSLIPRIAFALLLAVQVGGCINGREGAAASEISAAVAEGTELVYEPVIGYPILETRLTIRAHGGPSATLDYEYRHPARPEFDTDVHMVLEADGSLRGSAFDCAPNFPAPENDGCDRHLAGYSTANGVVGGLFGVTLLAGMNYEPGYVERPFSTGTRWVTGRFSVSELPDGLIEISAADEETRELPYPIAELTDPISDCSIFTGRVVLDVSRGVPVSCLKPDGGGEYGWTLVQTDGLSKPSYRAAIPEGRALAGSTKMPAATDDDQMPFGLHEALQQASASDSRIADFLAREPYLAESVMQFSGGSSTGDCTTVCVSTKQLSWLIQLEVDGDRASFRVTKTIDQPGNLERFSVTDVAFTDAPSVVQGFPPSIRSLGTIWSSSVAEFGFQPVGLHYFTSRVGPDQSVLEPFVRVAFSAPQGEGLSPFVVYRADGSIALWQAAGAQADPFFGSCACPVQEVCC